MQIGVFASRVALVLQITLATQVPRRERPTTQPVAGAMQRRVPKVQLRFSVSMQKKPSIQLVDHLFFLSLVVGCKGNSLTGPPDFLLARRCSEKNCSEFLCLPPVEFQWRLWFVLHVRDVSCGHKFILWLGRGQFMNRTS